MLNYMYLLTAAILSSIPSVAICIEENVLKKITSYNQPQLFLPTEKEGGITEVDISIEVTGFHLDINSLKATVMLNLRQRWEDSRLNYTSLREENATGSDVIWGDPYRLLRDGWMEEIWQPTTYITNAVSSSIQNRPASNSFARLYANGSIYWNTRAVAVLRCPAKKKGYPSDTHVCTMRVASSGYNADHVILKWSSIHPPVQYSLEESLASSSSQLLKTDTQNCSLVVDREAYSCIQLAVYVSRTNSVFVTQVYFPSIMTVVLSWLAFWIDREAILARVSLGSLCVVTIMTHATGLVDVMPEDATGIQAVHVWEITCISLIFAAMLEFATMHAMLRRKQLIMQMLGKEEDETRMKECQNGEEMVRDDDDEDCAGRKEEDNRTRKRRAVLRRRWYHTDPAKIDIVARRLFPITFIIFNLIYWIYLMCA